MRFADLIQRQLALFREDNGELMEACAAADRAYVRARRDEAEERYAEYLELVEEGTDALAEIRDTYASTLDPPEAEAYEQAFDREAKRRLPLFASDL